MKQSIVLLLHSDSPASVVNSERDTMCDLSIDKLSPMDEIFLNRCIDLASAFERNIELTPFASIIVSSDGKDIGEGISSVVRDHNPIHHAEILAIEEACAATQSHLLSGCTLFCNGTPCPMCYTACRWANIDRIVCAATLKDSELVGFQDRQFYLDLAHFDPERPLPFTFSSAQRPHALALLHEWKRCVDATPDHP